MCYKTSIVLGGITGWRVFPFKSVVSLFWACLRLSRVRWVSYDVWDGDGSSGCLFSVWVAAESAQSHFDDLLQIFTFWQRAGRIPNCTSHCTVGDVFRPAHAFSSWTQNDSTLIKTTLLFYEIKSTSWKDILYHFSLLQVIWMKSWLTEQCCHRDNDWISQLMTQIRYWMNQIA